jgi:Inner membrane component of T3SS, cytoplasmic domain/Inner membrane component of T3SS, periplasmic domain
MTVSTGPPQDGAAERGGMMAIEKLRGVAVIVARRCAADVRATVETFGAIGFQAGAFVRRCVHVTLRMFAADGRTIIATIDAVGEVVVRACAAVVRACVDDVRATFATLRVIGVRARAVAEGGISLVVRVLVAGGRGTTATLKAVTLAVVRAGMAAGRVALAALTSVGLEADAGIRLVARAFAAGGRASVAIVKAVTLAGVRAGVASGRATLEALRVIGLQAHAGMRLVVRAFAAIGRAIIATAKIAALAARVTLQRAARVIAGVGVQVVATFEAIAGAAGVGSQRSAPFMRRIAAECRQAIAAVYLFPGALVATSLGRVRHMPAALKRAVAGGRSASDLANVTFEVLSGLHGGVLLRLENGDYQIGSTAEADIVLRDPGVAPAHAILVVQRGAIRLEATGGDVGVGEQMISKGHGCRLKLPLDLSLGEACFRLSAIESRSAGRLQWAIAGIAVCSVVFVGLLTIGSFHYDDLHAAGASPSGLASVPQSNVPQSNVPQSNVRLASNVPPSSVLPSDHSERDQDVERVRDQVERGKKPAADIDEASQELTARVNGANIHNVRVNAAQGRLLVSGLLDKRDVAAWSEVARWFDQTYQGRVVLTTNFSVGGSQTAPLLQLRAVWFGEGPYVITADGRHLTVGSGLDNGWTIKEIGRDRIVLAKDGESVPQSIR